MLKYQFYQNGLEVYTTMIKIRKITLKIKS